MLTHFDAIVIAGKLLAVPGIFTQDAYARDKKGNPIGPKSARAKSWSAYGIMYHVFDVDPARDVARGPRAVDVAFQCLCAFDIAAGTMFRHSIEYVNDEIWREDPKINDRHAYCHERVLACMRHAAKRAKSFKTEERFGR